MICVATMIIHIPTPGTGGYANLGDAILLTCAFLISPGSAVASAAFGSMLADILSGYMIYAPGTLVIKGITAWIAVLISRWSHRENISNKAVFAIRLLAGSVAELFMAAGYFFYEAVILSYGLSASASVPANLAQGVVGLAAAMVLSSMLMHSTEIREFLRKYRS